MVENLKITPKGSYIYCDYTGEFSVDAGMACIDAMVDACIEHKCFKALFDCSHMSGEMGIFQRFQVIQHAEKTRDIALKTAILGRDDQVLPDKFAETVAMNRGINLRVFTDIDEAKRWLAEQRRARKAKKLGALPRDLLEDVLARLHAILFAD